jgi:hypothetical protein
MDCFIAQCERDEMPNQFSEEVFEELDKLIIVPPDATGAFVKYIFFDEYEATNEEDFDVNDDSVKTAYISFGEYNQELDRCSLTGTPDDQIFFYSTHAEFPSLFDEHNEGEFLLVSEPIYNFDTIRSNRVHALKNFPMQCVVMLHLPDNTMGKFYGAFENGGEAFDFIVNSSESHGTFAIIGLRNPDKKRDYHDWWLPEFSDGAVIPHDEWNFSK